MLIVSKNLQMNFGSLITTIYGMLLIDILDSVHIKRLFFSM